MKWFRDMSISWKLTSMAVFTCFMVLLGTTVAFSIFDHRMTKAGMIESYSISAEVFGRNCQPALLSSNAEDATTVLSSLNLDPQVSLACLYDADEVLLASFRREGNTVISLDQVRPFDRSFANDGYLHLIRPVKRGARIIGHIYLRVGLDNLWNRLSDQLRLAIVVLCISSILSIALAARLQRVISQPILRLVEVAHKVTQSGDYSLRAERDSSDELGELVSEFNQMLTVIESRTVELSHHRENLTELVHARTSALEKKSEEAMAASVAKSDFLANMSHEIRTPLNAIMGYTDLLCRDWSDSPEERNEMLKAVHSSGRHLMTVINDILDLSKIESGRVDLELQPESPHNILSDVVSLMRVQYHEKNLTLDYNWEGLVPVTIQADGVRLRQVLINLLGNAKKFTLVGGVRMIARVEGEATSAKLIVNVIDSGVGIPSDKHHQIFEPFMQADNSVTRKYGGTGLGLSISRRLARLMGGDISVESSPGAGSDFRLSVATGDLSRVVFNSMQAISDLIPHSSLGQSPSVEIPMLTGLRVLLVDDGDSNRKLISLILKRVGAELTEAVNGKEACKLALGGNTYDVILLDMQMPVMDGYTAAKTMREAGLATTIIALTAHAMKEDRHKCMDAGCSDYLAKPVSADELLDRMRTIYELLYAAPSTRVENSRVQEPIRSKLPIEDPEFAAIVVDFIPALRREVDRLANGVRSRDPVETLASSHWIRGAGGTAGFGCFTIPAGQITTAVRSNTWTDVDRLSIAIQDYADRLEMPEIPELVEV